VIQNEDGQEKQDYERNAAKRWLEHNGQRYAWLKPTLLGDDLYSDYNTSKAVMDAGQGIGVYFQSSKIMGF
jgi:hypothetical protein